MGDRRFVVAGAGCLAFIMSSIGCGGEEPGAAIAAAPEGRTEEQVAAEASREFLTSLLIRRFAAIEVRREDDVRLTQTGFVLNAEEVLVPIDGLLEAVSVSVRPGCCEPRPSDGVVAFDVAQGYAVLRFTPPLDGYEDLPVSGTTPAAGDEVGVLHRLNVRFEDGYGVANFKADALGPSGLAGFDGVSVYATRNNSLLDAGTLVVDDGGQPIGMFTRWAGFGRKMAVRFGDVRSAPRGEPIPWDEFRADLMAADDRVAALALLAESRRSEGRYEDAEEAALAAIEADPACWLAHYQFGVIRDLARGEASLSERSLRRAIELEPAWFESHYSLGLILIKQEREGEAVAPLRAAVEIAPDYGNALGMLGVALWDTEGPAAGRPWIERACDASPDDFTHLDNLRELLDELGDPAGLVDRYRGFVERNPDHDTAGMMLSIMLYRQGLFAEAVPHVSKFAESSRNPRAHSLLVECLIRAHRVGEAEVALERLADLDPEHASIPGLRSMLERAADGSRP